MRGEAWISVPRLKTFTKSKADRWTVNHSGNCPCVTTSWSCDLEQALELEQPQKKQTSVAIVLAFAKSSLWGKFVFKGSIGQRVKVQGHENVKNEHLNWTRSVLARTNATMFTFLSSHIHVMAPGSNGVTCYHLNVFKDQQWKEWWAKHVVICWFLWWPMYHWRM